MAGEATASFSLHGRYRLTAAGLSTIPLGEGSGLLNAAFALLLLPGFYPLWRAWQANRQTTLGPTVGWAAVAWAAWICMASFGPEAGLARYAALALTGSAGVAVLGARRPIVAAWNFIVASLLVVLLWPVVEGMGALRLNGFQATLLAAALLVGAVNYLPTRSAAAILPAAAACAVEMGVVLAWLDPNRGRAALGLLAVAPWLGLAATRKRSPMDAIEREWLDFRDRFGAVWALPAQEQFNRASANAGWRIVLRWGGSRPSSESDRRDEALAGLRALLKRFRTNDDQPAEPPAHS